MQVSQFGFLSIKYFVLRATEKCAQYCSSAERKFVVLNSARQQQWVVAREVWVQCTRNYPGVGVGTLAANLVSSGSLQNKDSPLPIK